MSGFLNKLGAGLITAAFSALPLAVVHAADLTTARAWAGPDYTRVVLVSSGPISYTTKQNGGEIQVDLPGSKVTSGFATPAAQGLYQGMSYQRQGANLKLTAKVAPGSRLKSFVLAPKTGNEYRLVLDFYPGSAQVAKASPATQVTASAAPAVSNATRASNSGRAVTEQAAVMLNGQRKVVVAIDAGHGGKDQGAKGSMGTLEKDITLSVARKLAAEINRQPGMQAVLTRDGDYFIPLQQRYKIARDNNADLFVSVHADSFIRSDARGSSVWVLSPRGKTSMAARWLADGENRADLIGGITLDDKDDALAKVLLDLQQGWAMQASEAIASNVLKGLATLGPTHRGHVERANFVVLRSPDVPSILVETAFISNPAEEKKLRDPVHQDKLAAAMMGGLKTYFESTPPPGTWFAAQAARRSGTQVASSGASTSASVASGRNVAKVTAARSSEKHRVNRGESLGSIARRYGVSVSALKSANRMSADTLRAGTVLAIPNS